MRIDVERHKRAAAGSGLAMLAFVCFVRIAIVVCRASECLSAAIGSCVRRSSDDLLVNLPLPLLVQQPHRVGVGALPFGACPCARLSSLLHLKRSLTLLNWRGRLCLPSLAEQLYPQPPGWPASC